MSSDGPSSNNSHFEEQSSKIKTVAPNTENCKIKPMEEDQL